VEQGQTAIGGLVSGMENPFAELGQRLALVGWRAVELACVPA
jgi:hypothetical protein